MTMLAVRNRVGRFMSPSSSNSMDAHLPTRGIRSRVKAKNLILGDKMLMRGERAARVLSLVSAFDEHRGERMIVTFRTVEGFIRVRDYAFNDRVSVLETPRSRRERRAESRVEYWARYTGLTV